jgi:hypothetical protein
MSLSTAFAPEEPLASTAHAPALLSFRGNRAPFVSSHKAVGTFRIVVVGDSMTFGQGIPHSKTLSQRLATHLNGALADHVVEGIGVGSCGACLFHALERVEHQALQLEPDVIIVAACCNDAAMLRNPLTHDDMGRTWKAFRPHLDHALAGFADSMRQRRVRTAILYFDRTRVYGAVDVAGVLRDICETNALPFVDGSTPLATYGADALTVSVADGHLNALANDIVARHLTRALGELGWLPAPSPFSDSRWLDAVHALPRHLEAAGVPPLLATARAMELLDSKWADRRNRSREATTAAYQRIRTDLANRRLEEGRLAVWSAAGRHLHDRHRSEGVLAFTESRLHELSVLVSALEFAGVHGDVQQNLDEIVHIIGDSSSNAHDTSGTTAAARPRIQDTRATMQAVQRSLPLDRRRLSPELRAVETLTARAGHLLGVLDIVAERLSRVRPMLSETTSTNTHRLLAYADLAVGDLCARLAALADRMPWARITEAARSWQVPPVMKLELMVAADPGPETWPLSIAVESLYPFYQEVFLHSDNLIRDGNPHAYVVELPISLLGDIYLHFAHIPVDQAEAPGPLRVFPATLTAAGLPPRVMPRLQFVNRTANGATFAYRSVLLLEDSQ